MLLAAEEFLLFLLDEQHGTLLPMTERTEHLVLAGAVLMDLQLCESHRYRSGQPHAQRPGAAR